LNKAPLDRTGIGTALPDTRIHASKARKASPWSRSTLQAHDRHCSWRGRRRDIVDVLV